MMTLPPIVEDELWSTLLVRVGWYVRRGFTLKTMPEETRLTFEWMCRLKGLGAADELLILVKRGLHA